MIAGSPATRTAAPAGTLWLARPAAGPRPPPRAPAADRAIRAALFARLAAAGEAPAGGAHLSHAGGHAAYLCGAVGAGIDLEWVRPRDVGSLARFAYAAAEADALASLAPSARDVAFTELWVLKEAAAKVLGLDLFTALAQCRCRVAGGRIALALPGGATASAALWAPEPGLRLAWVCTAAAPRPAGVDFWAAEARAAPAAWPLVACTGGPGPGEPG